MFIVNAAYKRKADFDTSLSPMNQWSTKGGTKHLLYHPFFNEVKRDNFGKPISKASAGQRRKGSILTLICSR